MYTQTELARPMHPSPPVFAKEERNAEPLYRDDILSYLSSLYAQIFRIYNSYIAHLCAPCNNYIVSGDATHNCLPPPLLRNFLLVRLFTLPHA